jgi:hypothetical protein
MVDYLDIPVLELQPDAGDDAQGAFARAITLFDPTTGPRLVTDRGRVALPQRRSVPFILETRAEIATWLDFLDTLAGKQGVFWLPSWLKDFRPSQVIVDDSHTIRVINAGYTANVFGDLTREHIAIITPGPEFDYRKIVDSTEDGDEEVLTLSGAGLTALEPDGYLLSFLILYRLDVDDVAMNWTSRTRLEVTVDLVERPDETPTGGDS